MTNDNDGGSFEFVAHRPNERVSNETRLKIRRHAMKAVGASRRKPGEAGSRYYAMRPDRKVLHPLPDMPFSGLELLVKDYGLDPMDLSALTSVHIGPM
jgi:hypothetical protein